MTKKQVIFLKVAAIFVALFAILGAGGMIYFYGRLLSPTGVFMDAAVALLLLWSFYSNFNYLKKIGLAIEHNDATHLHS